MYNTPTYQQAQYLKSAAELNQLPPDEGKEIAFIGRSNAGKSSALNAITGIKGLARTSKIPGRTQMINFFTLDHQHRLVDLPGYGYAKVPRTVKERWEQNINEYLQTRVSLVGLVVVMDIRHPLKEGDQHLINWAVACSVPIHILLTKTDKLKPAAGRKVRKKVQDALGRYGGDIRVQLFSSIVCSGVDEARNILNHRFASQRN